MTSPAELLPAVIDVARRAGELLRAEALRPGGPRGSSRVSPADASAEALIRDVLEGLGPGFGVRGEELPARDRQPVDPEGPVWLIDPNDGTSAFHAGWRGSAVSIALIAGGLPVLGVVYAYLSASRGADLQGRDLIAWAHGAGPVTRNGAPISRAPWPAELGPEHILLVAHRADRRAHATARAIAPARYRPQPSIAYRLALVAVGEGVATASVAGPSDYDIAGGHAILRGVGGSLVGRDGREVRYEARRTISVATCFGGAPAIVAALAGGPPPIRRDPEPTWAHGLVEPARGGLVLDAGVLDRAWGCLLGQLAGDALGSLVEFEQASAIAQRHPNGVRLLQDGGPFNLIAGQPTDDSELALLLARSIVEQAGYDPEAAARAYARWIDSRPFDIGLTTTRALSAALEAMRAGRSAAQAARAAASQGSQANGALMRVSPLAIFGVNLEPSALVRAARADAALTHPHPVCQDANALFALLIAEAVREGGSGSAIAARAPQICAEHGLHPDVVETVRAAADGPPPDFHTQMGWVRVALHNALFHLAHGASVDDALVTTVGQGGDTDTNACIAGALLGAVYGRRAIPAQWEERVLTCRPVDGLPGVLRPRPKGLWPVDALVLAERLIRAS